MSSGFESLSSRICILITSSSMFGRCLHTPCSHANNKPCSSVSIRISSAFRSLKTSSCPNCYTWMASRNPGSLSSVSLKITLAGIWDVQSIISMPDDLTQLTTFIPSSFLFLTSFSLNCKIKFFQCLIQPSV